jgi:hypothetical protein
VVAVRNLSRASDRPGYQIAEAGSLPSVPRSRKSSHASERPGSRFAETEGPIIRGSSLRPIAVQIDHQFPAGPGGSSADAKRRFQPGQWEPKNPVGSCWFLLGARDARVAAWQGSQGSVVALPGCCIIFKNRSMASIFQHDAVPHRRACIGLVFNASTERAACRRSCPHKPG